MYSFGDTPISFLNTLEKYRENCSEEDYNETKKFCEWFYNTIYAKEYGGLSDAIEIVEKLFEPTTSFGYPYMDIYQSALREVIEAAKMTQCRCDEKETDKTDAEISSIIFKHGENDYSLWNSFVLAKEDEEEIHRILAKYETQGKSFRGTFYDIIDELEDADYKEFRYRLELEEMLEEETEE